ncbi:pyruvate ferredoxin oxidoreductase subunit gamma [Candidatus Woesearchaeota archaeon]|nr:pyruvate ferredoxin oxidoreductase subunit gamma [Candidatus Woesearchaeota archaeon]
MKEIRIHGRGGQGAVTAAQLLAISAFYDGKQSQAFPKFGVERRGAPVEAYCRIDEKPINVRQQLYEPDMLIVLDSSLFEAVDITKGLEEGGLIIANTNKDPEKLGIKSKFKVKTVDATMVALKIIGADIVNTSMLGAFAAATGLVNLKSINKAIEEKFAGRKKIIEQNKEAVKNVYDRVKDGKKEA